MTALARREDEDDSEILVLGQKTLGELAQIANREHDLAVTVAGQLVSHAVNAGEALLEARERLSSKKWSEWLTHNFAGSRSLASMYMRVARYRDDIAEDVPSMAQAYAAVKGLPDVASRGLTRALDDKEIAECRSMRAQGDSWQTIGIAMGVSDRTVQRYVDPGVRKRDSDRLSAIRRARRELERNQAITHAVRKAGAALAEAYSMAERMQDVIAQAHREATDSEVRRALALAGEHERKMRDQIVVALGVA